MKYNSYLQIYNVITLTSYVTNDVLVDQYIVSHQTMRFPAILRINNLEINTEVSIKLPDELRFVTFTADVPLLLNTTVNLTLPFNGIQSVYLIEQNTNESKQYKIGYGNPNERLKAFRTGNPFQLKLLACCPGGRSLENKFQVKYADKKIKGEWFSLTDKDVEDIMRIMAVKYFKSRYA